MLTFIANISALRAVLDIDPFSSTHPQLLLDTMTNAIGMCVNLLPTDLSSYCSVIPKDVMRLSCRYRT